MKLHIWIHEGRFGPGFEALGLDHLGFSTWAPSRDELLSKVIPKFEEYRSWLREHEISPPPAAIQFEIVDEYGASERGIRYPCDEDACTGEEIEYAIRLLECARKDLINVLHKASEDALSWEGAPCNHFADWADWRSIKATLAHLAATESHFYLRNIDYACTSDPPKPADDWRAYLSKTREEAIAFLRNVSASNDLLRLRTIDAPWGKECWSVRKVLRRMVWHERMHTKSIKRILRTFDLEKRVTPYGGSKT